MIKTIPGEGGGIIEHVLATVMATVNERKLGRTPTRRVRCYFHTMYSPPPCFLAPGGSSLRRRWRKEVSAGANPTWPRCPYTASLNCERASRRGPSCWTWKPPLCLRLSVGPLPTLHSLYQLVLAKCTKLHKADASFALNLCSGQLNMKRKSLFSLKLAAYK